MEDTIALDRSTEMFTRHNDSVLCCSIDNRSRLAATGGIDDTAFVWDITTKHVIFECVGHKESVVATAFSVNSTYVATGDLNGYIQVRNTTTGIKIFEYDIDEINWIIWHNTSEFVLLAGTTKGDFWMWNVNDPAAVKTFPPYGSPTTAAKILSDGVRIASGYGDGSLRVFDLKSREAIFQLNDSTHAEIISLDINHNNSLIALGYVDSKVKLVNLSARKAIGTLSCKSPNSDSTSGKQDNDSESEDTQTTSEVCLASAEELEVIDERSTKVGANGMHDNEGADGMGDDDAISSEDECFELMETDSVESVLFSPCGRYLVAANNSGSIFIWDVATQTTRCNLHTGIGITRCLWSTGGNLITACLNGSIRIYDLNLNRLAEISVHSDQVLDIAYRNKVLVTASEDKTCKVLMLEN